MMEKQNNEFLELLCNLYLVALLLALPLYTGQGYWQLGETKYTLFRGVTLLCLIIWLAAGMPARLRKAAVISGRFLRRGWGAKGEAAKEGAGVSAGIDGMDLTVAVYALCTTVSAVCSSYGQLAWQGYEGWYMGAVSQLLFAGIYFFVSRHYEGASWPLYLGEAALGLVTVLGLLHRMGIDPLGLLKGWNSGDWEYSHMLSTLGNINWLCGYYSVALAFLTVHYLLEKRFWVWLILYVTEVSAFVLLGIQGSQGGILILAVCCVTCLWLGRHRAEIAAKVFLALAGFFAAMPLMWQLMVMRGDKAAVVADGNVFQYVAWYVWLMGAAVSMILFFYFRRSTGGKGCRADSAESGGKGRCANSAESGGKRAPADSGSRNRRNGKRAAGLMLAGLLGVIMLAGYLHRHPFGDSFGSGRGFLWRISVESFTQAGLKDKLLGAGPDCYGEAVFQRLGADTEVWKDEHWEGAVFTNAHNEILSQLCNVGILGTLSYLAVFAAGLGAFDGGRRRRRPGRGRQEGAGEDTPCRHACIGGKNEIYYKWLGRLALAMYGMHAFISFQQVLSTPLLFLVLGICRRGRDSSRMGGNFYEMDEI